jgi:hypothetical protein
MLMWIATLAPLFLIAPRVVRWKPNWLGGVIACIASVAVSAIAGIALVYVLSDLTGTVRAGEALAGAIGKWGIATIISPFACAYVVMRSR